VCSEYMTLTSVVIRSTMKQLGLSLSEHDVHAMMRSVGVGPHGKISYPGTRSDVHTHIKTRRQNLTSLTAKTANTRPKALIPIPVFHLSSYCSESQIRYHIVIMCTASHYYYVVGLLMQKIG